MGPCFPELCLWGNPLSTGEPPGWFSNGGFFKYTLHLLFTCFVYASVGVGVCAHTRVRVCV